MTEHAYAMAQATELRFQDNEAGLSTHACLALVDTLHHLWKRVATIMPRTHVGTSRPSSPAYVSHRVLYVIRSVRG